MFTDRSNDGSANLYLQNISKSTDRPVHWISNKILINKIISVGIFLSKQINAAHVNLQSVYNNDHKLTFHHSNHSYIYITC